MPFENFCTYFTDLSICRLVNTSWFSFNKTWNEAFFNGKWIAGSKGTETDRAGGCYNNKDTFLQNPQVIKCANIFCKLVLFCALLFTNFPSQPFTL